MLEERDKWLFKIIGFITLIATVLVVTFLVSGHSLSIWDIIQFYSIPAGLLAGWGIVVLLEERKNKGK